MENEASQDESKAFSYDILDHEAHKISELLAAVNERCAAGGKNIAAELFNWAEELSANDHRAEAEFLYLYAVNLWEREFGVNYPIHFKSLRHYALTLRSRCTGIEINVDVQVKVETEVTAEPESMRLPAMNEAKNQSFIETQAA